MSHDPGITPGSNGSCALRVGDELPPEATDAVFAVPNRHALLWHVVSDVSVVAAIQGMSLVAAKMFADGPGSISDQLYWWRDGTVVHLPVRVRDQRIDFTPPDEFVEFLNTLAAP